MPTKAEGKPPQVASRPRLHLGIDPGLSGGMSVLSYSPGPRSVKVWLTPMPSTETDIWDWIAAFLEEGDVFATIEKVGGYVKGAEGAGGSGGAANGNAMFKFGSNFGALKMALVAAAVPFEEVVPATWQKAMGVSQRGSHEPKAQFKTRIKARAQQLFPGYTITLKTADSLLIAEYGRRKTEGRL